MTKQGSPLLLKLMTLLGETEVREQYLENEKGRYIYGQLGVDGIITVNPMPHIVDTLLHELLHRMFPDYSEHAVRSLTGKLMAQISEEEMQAIYEMYCEKVGT